METHFLVLSGAVDTDFIKKAIEGERVPNSRQTNLPALASALDPEFIEKPIKGDGYRILGKRNSQNYRAP